MKSESKLCLIVDAYSTGRFLPSELRKHGFDCVHVQSTPVIPEIYRASFNRADFIENIIYEGNLDETLERASQYNIAFLIVGTESGVELGDILSEKMELPSNKSAFSKARRNKFEMVEALRNAGLRCVNHIKSATVDEILSWANNRGKWPVVLKPINSAGTDNVIFCANESEIVLAFERIIQSRNLMGQPNSEVLAQEFLDGTEYFVNTVSVQGKHHVAEIWQYHKRKVPDGGYIYDMEEPLPFEGVVQAELRDYIKDVLDALKIQFGPAHSEVMMIEQRPVLIETGARLAGSILPAAVSKSMGCNQVELTVESYVHPEKFLEKVAKPYSLHKNLLYVSLISEREGILKSMSQIDEIRKLPSFFDMYLSISVGSQLRKTIDSLTSPGYVYLIHEDSEVLRKDYHTIRELERNGLYEVV
ncbi:ATP-grasp domain-containing protein [Chlorogloeopsis sp. ULAP01]|uniref:ATP-grasp domain-containing protein n=1 Tax=Chlorogloeopsis sp. ULAP01 TaxID=3056483 RepID=UPI0025AA3BAE|nr:ATP-grasp domain-containing protein [Chlorogloeopsis sp. ULAP01]MDM9382026.1 ATP-grasp domain-containing protein [Chlorogloeopsis sp. ULAP01]